MGQNSGSFVAYYRVSTARQGASGLGLGAQQEAVRRYLNGGEWRLVGEFTEVESGRRSDRPELERALAHCRAHRAALVVAKVDRLTRNVGFLTRLIEAGVDVRFADLPSIEGPIGQFMLNQMVAVAQLEAGLISSRTRDALAAAKARGQKLGGNRGTVIDERARELSRASRAAKARGRAADVAPIIRDIQASGVVSLAGIARALNDRRVPTSRGAGGWSAVQVGRALAAAGG